MSKVPKIVNGMNRDLNPGPSEWRPVDQSDVLLVTNQKNETTKVETSQKAPSENTKISDRQQRQTPRNNSVI